MGATLDAELFSNLSVTCSMSPTGEIAPLDASTVLGCPHLTNPTSEQSLLDVPLPTSLSRPHGYESSSRADRQAHLSP